MRRATSCPCPDLQYLQRAFPGTDVAFKYRTHAVVQDVRDNVTSIDILDEFRGAPRKQSFRGKNRGVQNTRNQREALPQQRKVGSYSAPHRGCEDFIHLKVLFEETVKEGNLVPIYRYASPLGKRIYECSEHFVLFRADIKSVPSIFKG